MSRSVGASDAELLTTPERTLLRALGPGQGVITPGRLARRLSWSVRRVAHAADGLSRLGLIHIRRLPKQVSYEITPAGQAARDEIGDAP